MALILPKDITILTVVENDRGLVLHMIKSVKKFTCTYPRIIICNNGDENKILGQGIRREKGITVVDNVIRDRENTNGSNRHGIGLDKIFPMVGTRYTAIIESDVILLSDKWRSLPQKYDLKGAYKGTRADDDYYYVCFLVFKTSLFRGMKWAPDNNRRFIHGKRDPRLYNDVGWAMNNRITHKNRIKKLDIISCKSGKTKFFDKRFAYKSFEMWEDGQPICAHFWRGSNIFRRVTSSPKNDIHNWGEICQKILKK